MNDRSRRFDRSSTLSTSRREFLKVSSLAAGAVLAGGLSVARGVHAAGSDEIRVALVGCGGRGTGAADNVLNNQAGVRVKLVALADAFRDRIDGALSALQARHPERVDVPEERRFTGLDCHQRAVEADIDLVLMCSPPGFRPMHFEAAVQAGRHVFLEKPVATDGPGYRRIMAANERAKQRNLAVAVGHHLRHEDKHRQVIARIHDGAIGPLQYVRAYFNSSGVWVRPREPGQTEMQHQVRNWYYFTWLSGDHIVEQHVHDLDIGNWMMGDQHPVEAQGMGGRQVRISPDHGEIYDHHAVEFTYADGTRMFSYCRHIPGCWESFSQHAHGTKGYASIEGHGAAELFVDGRQPQRFARGEAGHQLEMDRLLAAIRAGDRYNECDWAGPGSMTAILGRMATYSGQVVRWDDAVASELDLAPERFDWDAEPRVQPGPDGIYPCPVPGLARAW